MLDRALVSPVVSAFGLSPATDRLLNHRLAEEGRWVDLGPGARAFSEGDTCSSFLFVGEGCIRVSKATPAGRELLLYDLLPGEFCIVTASCLLGGLPYPARATAVEATSGVLFPDRVFHDLLSESPIFREAVFQAFATRLTDVMALVEAVAFQGLDQRLASLLLRRTERAGTELECTHQQLANDLGCSREIVSRVLEGFQTEGRVRLSRGRVSVPDPAGLAELLAPSD